MSINNIENPQSGGITKDGTTDGKGRLKLEDFNQGASFTFNITSNVEAEALLSVYITPKTYDYYLHDHYSFTVNGDKLTNQTVMVAKPAAGVECDGTWARYFVKVKIGTIKLKAGENTITFTANTTLGLIMDKIELISTSATVTGVTQAQ